ncbi:hypothetical protein MBLNU459_g6318t1 [Dothideomycetes sp. NU459]
MGPPKSAQSTLKSNQPARVDKKISLGNVQSPGPHDVHRKFARPTDKDDIDTTPHRQDSGKPSISGHQDFTDVQHTFRTSSVDYPRTLRRLASPNEPTEPKKFDVTSTSDESGPDALIWNRYLTDRIAGSPLSRGLSADSSTQFPSQNTGDYAAPSESVMSMTDDMYDSETESVVDIDGSSDNTSLSGFDEISNVLHCPFQPLLETATQKLLDELALFRQIPADPSSSSEQSPSALRSITSRRGREPNELNPGHHGSNPSKRKRRAFSGNDDEDDDDPDDRYSKPTPLAKANTLRPSRSLACPFNKLNPHKYKKCQMYQNLNTISRLNPSRGRWSNNTWIDVIEFPYIARHATKPLTARTKRVLTNTSKFRRASPKKTDEQNWYDIFDILFPGVPHPASPFPDIVLSAKLADLREFAAAQGVDIVLSVIKNEMPTTLQGNESHVQGFQEQVIRSAISRLLDEYQIQHDSTACFPKLEASQKPNIPVTPDSNQRGLALLSDTTLRNDESEARIRGIAMENTNPRPERPFAEWTQHDSRPPYIALDPEPLFGELPQGLRQDLIAQGFSFDETPLELSNMGDHWNAFDEAPFVYEADDGL